MHRPKIIPFEIFVGSQCKPVLIYISANVVPVSCVGICDDYRPNSIAQTSLNFVCYVGSGLLNIIAFVNYGIIDDCQNFLLVLSLDRLSELSRASSSSELFILATQSRIYGKQSIGEVVLPIIQHPNVFFSKYKLTAQPNLINFTFVNVDTPFHTRTNIFHPGKDILGNFCKISWVVLCLRFLNKLLYLTQLGIRYITFLIF